MFFVFLLLFFFKQIVFSALDTNGTWLRASERLTVHTWQFKANTENGHGIEIMMSQRYVQNGFGEATVQLIPGLPDWFRSLRTLHYCNVQQQGHPRCHYLRQNHSPLV